MMKRFAVVLAVAVFVTASMNGAGQTPAQGLNEGALEALAFRSLPTNIVTGRVQDIEIDPNDSNVWYVADRKSVV